MIHSTSPQGMRSFTYLVIHSIIRQMTLDVESNGVGRFESTVLGCQFAPCYRVDGLKMQECPIVGQHHVSLKSLRTAPYLLH